MLTGQCIKKSKQVRLICLTCKKEFFVYPYRAKLAKFCCKKCQRFTDQQRNHMGLGMKDKKRTLDQINRQVNTRKENAEKVGYYHSLKTRNNIGKSNSGKKRTIEQRLICSLSHKGIVSSKKNKTYEEFYGEERAKIIRKNVSKGLTGLKQSDSAIRNRMKSIGAHPNGFETRCSIFIDKIHPGMFEYCGDGSRIINGRCSDFISDKLKTVILCHGYYWHLKQYGLEVNDTNKKIVENTDSKAFLDAGYKVIFIWEDDFNKQMKGEKL